MRTPPESELKGGVSGALWMRRRKPRGKDAMRAQVVPTQGFPMQPRLIAFGNPRRTSIAAKAASASKMKATQIMIIELRRRLAFATGRLCSCRRHRRSDHQRRHRGGDSLGRNWVFQKGLRPTSEPERQAQRNDRRRHSVAPLLRPGRRSCVGRLTIWAIGLLNLRRLVPLGIAALG
jgi:hypothetical protein